jgi:hypothetical protein
MCDMLRGNSFLYAPVVPAIDFVANTGRAVYLSITISAWSAFIQSRRFVAFALHYLLLQVKHHCPNFLILSFFIVFRSVCGVMEKYNDSPSSKGDSTDFEDAALLNIQYQKQETQRRHNYVYLTLFNLFIFTLSMLSLICAVMSQKNISGYDAAMLMDQFEIFCKQDIASQPVPDTNTHPAPAMHEVEYSHVKFELPNPLNSSKYVGITDDVENAWMDIAYRETSLLL